MTGRKLRWDAVRYKLSNTNVEKKARYSHPRLNAMYMKKTVLSAVCLENGKEMGICRNGSYMTMQHLPFFSGISSLGSGTRVVLGFSLGTRLIDAGFGEGTRGLCGMVGVSLK